LAYTVWENLEQVERYACKRYRHWDQRWISNREASIVSRIFQRYRLRGPILDVPVGYGRFQELLSAHGPVQSLDFNYYAVLYQQQRLGISRASVNGLAENLPYKDNSFEIVFSMRLFQHVHERDQRVAILKEFKRVSRRWMIVSLYLQTPLHTLHRRISHPPSRITMLTKTQLLEELDAAGVRLEKMVAVVPGVHAHRICLLSGEKALQT
jgi:2-polyprenyl-3-methyl-5-hydroxy-6-metoxy-1,4-benzoquinol methylase